MKKKSFLLKLIFLGVVCLMQMRDLSAQQQKGAITGVVMDSANNILPGSSISTSVGGRPVSVITDQNGHFSFTKIPYGQYSLRITYIGFETVLQSLQLSSDQQPVKVVLRPASSVALGQVVVSTQKRIERLVTVPIAVTSLDSKTLSAYGIRDLNALSSHTPGLNIAVQSIQHPVFSIRGITSDDFGAFARSRLSVYHNGVPISRGGGAGIEIYDMSVEAIKGPQGTVFGQGSLVGGISYRSNMPQNFVETNATVGFGNYGQALTSFVLNTPIVKNKLLMRIGGIYDNKDGFIKNTYGGKLNGQNAMAGKAYFTYIPSANTQISLLYDYEKNKAPGTAFMTGLPNAEGNRDMFSHTVSLLPGKAISVERSVHEITANISSRLSNALHFTSITSYRQHKDYEYWDSDGAAANALAFIESDNVKHLYQELRLNYSSNRFKGFIGASYSHENMDASRSYTPNEQTLYWLYLKQPNKMVNPDGSPNYMLVVPDDIPELPAGKTDKENQERAAKIAAMKGKTLVSNRTETMLTYIKNSSVEAFADASLNVTDKFIVTGGLRVTRDFLESGYQGIANNVPSTVGYLLNSKQNYYIFKPLAQQSQSGDNTGITGRAVLQYLFNSNQHLYASFSTGRRPKVLQYDNNGAASTLRSESVKSFEIGYKHQPISNLSYDIAIYYYKYNNFLTRSLSFGDQFSGIDSGKATAYGAEVSLRYQLNKYVSFSGNYSYNHARFDDTNAYGKKQELAGQQFRLSPDHIFHLILTLTAPLNSNAAIYFTPSYAFKSRHILFEGTLASQPQLYQDAYGLVNAIAGLRFNKPAITFSAFCNNVLDKKYMFNGANTGKAYGIPGYVQGFPITYGMRLNYYFSGQ